MRFVWGEKQLGLGIIVILQEKNKIKKDMILRHDYIIITVFVRKKAL